MTVTGVGANFNGALSQEKIEIIEEVPELTVKEYVNKYFSDIPIMVEVARCESQFRQHDKRGNTLKGAVNEFDFGVMQINEMYHGAKAKKLGHDLHSIEGNTAYARYLFEAQGVQPWISSSVCWKKTQAYTSYRTELALSR
jgi:hypothetical protein